MSRVLRAVTDRDRVICALTLWAEARGEPREAQLGVLATIVNRAGNPRWWGGPSLASVCLRRGQFSCWNRSDPQRERLLGFLVDGDTDLAALTPSGISAVAGQLALIREFLDGGESDPTDGCTHYYNPALAQPDWGRSAPHKRLGSHAFYRPEDLTPPEEPIEPVWLRRDTVMMPQRKPVPQSVEKLTGIASMGLGALTAIGTAAGGIGALHPAAQLALIGLAGIGMFAVGIVVWRNRVKAEQRGER